MSNRKEIHERVLNASNREELMDAYREWADGYDHDLIDEMGYVAPALAGRLLMDHVDDNAARILDAGCGTGLVGAFMHENGYQNVEGLDYSRDMLEKAEEKQLYKRLNRADLMRPLDMPGDVYDAVISVGTFTCGHVGPEAVNELIRITKPGGYICFTVREQAWKEDGYRTEMKKIETRGFWKKIAVNTADYIQQEGASCKICLYQVAN